MSIKNKEPTLISVDGFKVIGLSVRTTNSDEFNPATAQLPDLWQRFYSSGSGVTDPDSIILGVYSDYESDASVYYTVTAGVKSASAEKSTTTVLSGEYLVFENQGVFPHVVVETWQRVWGYFEGQKEILRRFKTDFEMYKADGNIAIYIGV